MKFLNELLSAPLYVKIAALIVLFALVAGIYFIPVFMAIITDAVIVADWFC
jgi:hypothetical protein